MIQTHARRETHQNDPYVSAFERLENSGNDRSPSWIYAIRKAGIDRFAELGFPTLKDEDWRFTNVAPIAKLPFQPVTEYAAEGLDGIERFTFAGLAANRLVFVNGIYSQELSTIHRQSGGIKIKNLATALRTDSDLVSQHFGKYAAGENQAFVALNNAFFQDGAFIYIPAGHEPAEPVHLLYISTATEAGAAANPRNLIIAEANSRLTLLRHTRVWRKRRI